MLKFMPVVPWEAETDISLEVKSSGLAWATWRNCLKEKGKGCGGNSTGKRVKP